MKKLLLSSYIIFNLSFANAQYTNLLNFDSVNGSNPAGYLITDGIFLYGMTTAGGTNDMGTIFKIMPDGSGYLKLLDFAGTTNGRYPTGSFITDGTFLYGMTTFGGTNDSGTVFKIMPDGSGYVKLLDFSGLVDGAHAAGSLITDGTFLYGMTIHGGTNSIGTIFKIMPDGSGYVKLLDCLGASNGSHPRGSLISDGTFLYGVTEEGGINEMGIVFKIMPNGSGYVKLFDFSGAANGIRPNGPLITDGTYLYGMTSFGSANGMGTLYKIMSDGSGYVNILDFAGASNGSNPSGSLISDGTFIYGMTASGGTSDMGTIFKIRSDGTGYVNMLDFVGVATGSNPYSKLLSDGTFLYGMTSSGGTNNMGTIFKYQYCTPILVTANASDTIICSGNSVTLIGGGGDSYIWTGGVINGVSFNPLITNTYTVTGTDINGCSNTASQLITVLDCTGIEVEESSYLPVYPNPTTGKVNIVSKKEQKDVTLEVLNMVGQVMFSIKNINIEQGENYLLDISSLNDGTYLIRLSSKLQTSQDYQIIIVQHK